ncbi:hypothetical protein J3R82DRAFT_2695 [Butyriboletus roseoflavus]|nr:hypothetical protein J3R82DRAFT_2695 [Butyriboletus roseoflavus]
MATYSTLFSSGLLAPCIARCATPVLPSSPMAVSASPVGPIDRQLSLTPTPIGQTSPRPKALEARTNPERPAMRRRRSSMNVGVSPMALIKSPIRNAGAALQRTGFTSPTRHRAASVSMNEAFENNSLFGRLRSGSVGSIANPVKRLRRAIRRPVPLAPPPSTPLPAPPRSPTPKCGSSLLPPILVPTPRQPFITSSRPDDVVNLFPSTAPSPTLLSPDYTAKMPIRFSRGPSSGSRGDTIDEVMMEN